eukprot:259869_1
MAQQPIQDNESVHTEHTEHTKKGSTDLSQEIEHLKTQVLELEKWKKKNEIKVDNISKLQTENESLQEQVKKYKLTINTYQDESNKICREKEEMVTQIKFLKEKSEETGYAAVLKAESLSHHETEIERLMVENQTIKNNLNSMQSHLKKYKKEGFQIKE